MGHPRKNVQKRVGDTKIFMKERVGHAKKLTLLFTKYIFPMELPESASL